MPVLKKCGGIWVGWPGTADASADDLQLTLSQLIGEDSYALQPVTLSAEEVEGFYLGFSNEVIWPLFHDLQTKCNFDPNYWDAYQAVNRKYAKEIAKVASDDDFIWVQDYHLMQLAAELRQLHLKNQIGFFLHIPFPPLDTFLKLPWRLEIMCALLQFDLVGFQTLRDRRNFLQCIRALFENILIDSFNTETEQTLTISISHRDICSIYNDEDIDTERKIRIGCFPIGIDYKQYARYAAREDIAKLTSGLRSKLRGRKIILGMDRMDYTKGIPNRLKAFALALRYYPELIEHVTLVQHIAPSREDIPEYQELKNEIEHLVSEINGEFTRSGWIPVHYFHHSISFNEIIAYYRAADIALITPLKDGMNLVAKEYCAAQVDDNGVLILSEFAGAADQLQKGALLVNPFDVEGTAKAIYKAINMPEKERNSRMHQLRKIIHDSDIFSWVDSILHKNTDKIPDHIHQKLNPISQTLSQDKN